MFPSDLETILFDAGGTLVHVDYDHVVAVAAAEGVAVDRERMPLGDAAARLAVDLRLRDTEAQADSDAARIPHYFADLLIGAGVGSEDARALAPKVQEAHFESNLWRVAFDDAAETLAALRRAGLATAVISNADGRIRSILDAAGLLPHLDYVIDSYEEGVEKPDPEIFRRALARSGTAPDRALYVGDIYAVDVLGARGAGIEACLLDPTGGYGTVDCPTVVSLTELGRRLVRGVAG